MSILTPSQLMPRLSRTMFYFYYFTCKEMSITVILSPNNLQYYFVLLYHNDIFSSEILLIKMRETVSVQFVFFPLFL